MATVLGSPLGGGVAVADGPAGGPAAAVRHGGSGEGGQAPVTVRSARVYASAATLNVLTRQMENFGALVTDAETGQPLAGKAVKFYLADGKPLGTAYTNSGGTATINVPLDLGTSTVQAVLGGGYFADLIGDGTYGRAQGHGTIGLGTV
ncbi:hypothetical protein CTZ27_19080 [Streptomyces griseocarneus]|nr:hypothetical protein CTZ27_19080 [Streptomyces griseocarneus]